MVPASGKQYRLSYLCVYYYSGRKADGTREDISQFFSRLMVYYVIVKKNYDSGPPSLWEG